MSTHVRSTTPRLIFPPRGERRSFPDLTAGEAKVLDYLDRSLVADWEIYVQRHLNGLRPDFVLLHPGGGVLILEVKDWTLESWGMKWKTRPQSAPLPVGCHGTHELAQRNPVEQVLNYRSEISSLYAVDSDGKPGPADVALVFPFAPRQDAISALAPALEHRRKTTIPIVGRDDLANPAFDVTASAMRRMRSTGSVARLREWLVGSAEIVTTEPVPLTPRQRELITTRTDSGFRRIRGAAGSGKSLVLAGRAAQLSREGKDVLVVSFNHTLNSYLRRTAASFGTDSNKITWLGFHEWCSRVMADTARWPQYQALWNEHPTGAVLDAELPAAVSAALKADPDNLRPATTPSSSTRDRTSFRTGGTASVMPAVRVARWCSQRTLPRTSSAMRAPGPKRE